VVHGSEVTLFSNLDRRSLADPSRHISQHLRRPIPVARFHPRKRGALRPFTYELKEYPS